MERYKGIQNASDLVFGLVSFPRSSRDPLRSRQTMSVPNALTSEEVEAIVKPSIRNPYYDFEVFLHKSVLRSSKLI
jgi:hypothetical protein